MASDENRLSGIISSLPPRPGVYQFSDGEGKIIYVGKAKNLKNRVSSYFGKSHTANSKTRILVRKTADIRYFVVASEYEALLLENSMIKEYQPRYNIMLKDDKTYPFICIRKERFPRVFPTRSVIKDGSEYFGPYASGRMMHTLLELIRQLYPLRTCTYDLSEKNIAAGKYKVCLEYHLKNCLGPCENLQSEAEYMDSVRDIRNILQGNINRVISHLVEKMDGYSAELEYEKALFVKEKIEVLRRYRGKSTVVSPDINDLDVFSCIEDGDTLFVNYLKVINGAIVQGHTVEVIIRMGESAMDVFLLCLVELRQRFKSVSKEIAVPFAVELEIPGVKWTVPLQGDKRKLTELSERNARAYLADRLKRMSKTDPVLYQDRIMDGMQKDLALSEKPLHIECFDNSNIQGSSAVAACVVFRNGRPSKKEYRHFNIKSVEGPDDFASMREIVYRRYRRMLDEGGDIPQLIVIDGGKGQLSAAYESLEKLGLTGKTAVIGMAKRLEEIYRPNDSTPVYLSKRSESLKVIQHIRNEAHRFGIGHHRDKRSKASLGSSLSDIPGIGPESAKQLLLAFKSVKRISGAELEELESVVGRKRAESVFAYFRQLS